MALAVEQRLDVGDTQPLLAQGGQHQMAPALAAHAPGQAGARAKHGVDLFADGATVLGAGETVVAAPGLQHLVGAGVGGAHRVEHLGGGGETGGGRHVSMAKRTRARPNMETIHASDRNMGTPSA